MTEIPSGGRRSGGGRPRAAPRPERIDLGQVLARLRRALRRALKNRLDVDLLTEAQVELLRLVESTPGIRVSEAATALGMAPNTVSTLVTRLAEAAMIERTPDPHDGRGGRLQLTASAQAQVVSWREQRATVIGEALSKLDAADGAAIDAALPALWRLSRMLESSDDG